MIPRLFLKASEFVSHDLSEAVQICDDYQAGDETSFPYELNLRAWMEIDAATEFRLFIRNRRLIGQP